MRIGLYDPIHRRLWQKLRAAGVRANSAHPSCVRHRGVTDTHGQVHGIDNVFVAGSSLFPTSGYSNPTFTLVALALRTADRLKHIL